MSPLHRFLARLDRSPPSLGETPAGEATFLRLTGRDDRQGREKWPPPSGSPRGREGSGRVTDFVLYFFVFLSSRERKKEPCTFASLSV
jgi:hypothetical protein